MSKYMHVLFKDNLTPVKSNVIIVQVSLVTLWCQQKQSMIDRGIDGRTDDGRNDTYFSDTR